MATERSSKKASAKRARTAVARSTANSTEPRSSRDSQADAPAQTPGGAAVGREAPVVRVRGARAEFVWDGLARALGPLPAALSSRPHYVAVALVDRLRFDLGGAVWNARLDSSASSDDALRVSGPQSVLEAIAAKLAPLVGDTAALEALARRCDPEILRGWIAW